jgi:hypothetical protein
VVINRRFNPENYIKNHKKHQKQKLHTHKKSGNIENVSNEGATEARKRPVKHRSNTGIWKLLSITAAGAGVIGKRFGQIARKQLIERGCD